MEAVRISIRPKMWHWAFERAGMNAASLTAKFPKLPEWMDGKAAPTVSQARTFAKCVHIPFQYLLLSAPIKETLPIADFRTVGNRKTGRPSLDLLDTIRICKQRQDWYAGRLEEDGVPPLDFVGSLSPYLSVSKAADAIRKKLGWDPWSDDAKDRRNDFPSLREKAEAAGILVMVSGAVGTNTKRILSIREFRGFALADNRLAPLVFVNGQDSSAAKLFTLVHEIAHVFLGSSGISSVNMEHRTEPGVEGWCNRVAAEFLVPSSLLQGLLPDQAPADLPRFVEELANKFRVSRLVILLRLREVKWLDADDFQNLFKNAMALVPRRTGGGGNFFRTQISRVSPTFAAEMVRCVFEGRETYTTAFRMLGVKNADGLRKIGSILGVV